MHYELHTFCAFHLALELAQFLINQLIKKEVNIIYKHAQWSTKAEYRF